MPTTQNIDRIIRDFSDGRQQYLGAHLFFLDGTHPFSYQQIAQALIRLISALPEPLFQRLTSSPAEPHLKGLKEIFVNFWGKLCVRVSTPGGLHPDEIPSYPATEAQTFSLNTPELFFNIYSPPRNEAAFKSARSRLEEELRFVSKRVRDSQPSTDQHPY